MPRTDNRGRHGDDFSPHAGLTGVNLPIFEWHGSRDDLLRLTQSVMRSFGGCECVTHTDFFGNSCQGHPCAGHLFLAETDDAGRTLEWTVPDVFGFTHFTSGSLSGTVTRLDRLLFVRGTLAAWLDGEGFRDCPKCGRRTFHDDKTHGCTVPQPFRGIFVHKPEDDIAPERDFPW